MQTVFYFVQIVLSVTLIAVILMQAKSASLGGAFGGSDASIYTSRRGLERVLFQFTVILAAIFLITSLIVVLLSPA